MKAYLNYLVIGFIFGFGYHIAEDFWWLITGMLSVCRG